MSCDAIRLLPILLALVSVGHVWVGPVSAQEAASERWAERGASEFKGAHPPADATPEQRRAFWRQRAAERAASDQASVPSHSGVDPQGEHASRPPQDAGQEDRRTLRQKDSAERVPAAKIGGDSRVPGRMGTSGGSGGPPNGTGGPSRWGGGRDAVLWLTDAPIKRDGKGTGRHGMGGAGGSSGGKPGSALGMAGMSGMGETGPDGVPTKRVWLRAGGNPLTARPATGDEAALVLGPGGKPAEVKVEPHGGPYNIKFPMPQLGYYNVYFLRRALEQDTLAISAAKAEIARGVMGQSGDSAEQARLTAPMTDARVPVEIVRLRKDKEGLFTRINYGDEITFQVLKAGKPVQNARVTFTSGQGWSNSAQSDEDGQAVFTVIRDYYPGRWELFEKRHRETYLVSASFTTPDSGEQAGGKYASIRYTATLSGAYYPGMADYESYSSGLMIGMAGLVLTGGSVYLFRRRRVKPFREVQFDE